MREARSGPLCWAQHWFWLTDCVVADGESQDRMMHWPIRITAEVSIADVRRALVRLMEKYEALRTVYPTRPDGLPTQVVLAEFEPRMVLVDLNGHNDSLARIDGHLPPRFDLAAETSFTAVLGVRDSVVRRLRLAAHRLSVDGVSIELMRRELHEQINVGRCRDATRTITRPWQPIDQAGAEAADKASGMTRRGTSFWESELASGSHASLPIYWEADGATSYVTRTLVAAEALETIAKRCRATTASVIQALLAVVCAGWTGHRSCAMGTVTANRVKQVVRSSVGRYASAVRVVLDVDRDLPISVFIQRVHNRLLTAYLHGNIDIGEMTMQEVRQSSLVGARIITSILFEYHYYREVDECEASGIGGHQDRSIHQAQLDGHVPQLRFDVLPSHTAIELVVTGPSSLLDSQGARLFLAQLRDLIDMAGTGEPSTDDLIRHVRLPAPWLVGDWASIRQAWINLHDVAQLVERHPGVTACTVTVEPDGDPDGGGRLVAHVVTHSATMSDPDLDQHMRDLVSHHPTTMAPHRYVIRTLEPSSVGRDGIGSGGNRRESAASDSRPSLWKDDRPRDRSEEALAEVFRARHHGLRPRMTNSYAEAGGEFLRIPGMLDGIAAMGLGGLAWNDFIGFASMRTLAAKLRAGS